jgi:flagellar biosynthesis/type III secretory pathway protein FliH
MSIRLIGNDIEIDGQKVARVLDITSSLRMSLEDYVRQADEYEQLSSETSSLHTNVIELEKLRVEAYEEGRADGYSEGKNNAEC